MNNKEMVEIWGRYCRIKGISFSYNYFFDYYYGKLFFLHQRGGIKLKNYFFGLGGGAVLGFIISTI